MNDLNERINIPLLLGDWLTLALVTVIGFLSHNQQIQFGRFLAIAIPICLSWILTAPWFGILTRGKDQGLKNWWKIGWAVLLAVPLAVILRGLVLGSAVQVSFTFVMIATSMLGLWIWRFVWSIVLTKNK
ncbi:MAG: DUF3054 domain-containing protein [Anaerolineaceae bacterium]